MRLRWSSACSFAVAAIAGCAAVPPAPPAPSSTVAAFSSQRPGAALPPGWKPWIVAPNKSPTRYELVLDATTRAVVLQASASASASGVMQPLDVDPQSWPLVQWDWRLVQPIVDADLTDRYRDDSPLRLLLFFDGDRAALPQRERMLMETAALLTGQEVPFATLVYAWDPRAPVGSVVPNAVTRQLKTVVVANGTPAPTDWKRFERDYVDDYRRAFGAPPGRLVGIGVLTDSDNTRASAAAMYGDIRLLPAP
jgi:hypothetical protein